MRFDYEWQEDCTNPVISDDCYPVGPGPVYNCGQHLTPWPEVESEVPRGSKLSSPMGLDEWMKEWKGDWDAFGSVD